MHTCKQMKWLCISVGRTFFKATGPRYKQNCLNSDAFQRLNSFNPLGFLEKLDETYSRILMSLFEISDTDPADNLTFSGPPIQRFNNLNGAISVSLKFILVLCTFSKELMFHNMSTRKANSAFWSVR